LDTSKNARAPGADHWSKTLVKNGKVSTCSQTRDYISFPLPDEADEAERIKRRTDRFNLLVINSTARCGPEGLSDQFFLPVSDGCACFLKEAVLPLCRAFGAADSRKSIGKFVLEKGSPASPAHPACVSNSPLLSSFTLQHASPDSSHLERLASLSRLIMAEVSKSNGSVQHSGFKPFLAGHPSKYVD